MTQDTTKNSCIVIKSGSGPMALVRENGLLQLPVVEGVDLNWPPKEAAEINGRLMDQYGLNCTLMRWLERQDGSNLLVMEWHPGSPTPEVGVEWVEPRRDDLPLSPEQRYMVGKWRESTSDGLAPWENPGWMKEVVMSLIGIFNGVRHPQLTNLAQIKAAWGMSTVLVIETGEDEYFFKAGTRLGIDEWKLTKLLHGKFPDYVPDPMLVDEQRGWMITKKIENTPFAPLDHARMGNAFRAYAEIQLGCGDFVQTGIAPGLRVRSASWLRSHVDNFCMDDNGHTEFKELKSQLNAQQLATLRSTWLQHIAALDASALPLGLNQEDLHFENILNTLHGPVIIDWADCAMAHPFFSFHRIFGKWKSDNPENDRLERHHAINAYLATFSHLADDDQIQREVELTGQLSTLYQAFRWQEMAGEHKSGSVWGMHCSGNAVRLMKDAIEQA